MMCPKLLRDARPTAVLCRPVRFCLIVHLILSEHDRSFLRTNASVLCDENQVLSRAVLAFLVRNRLPRTEGLVKQTHAHAHRVKCHLNEILASVRSL